MAAVRRISLETAWKRLEMKDWRCYLACYCARSHSYRSAVRNHKYSENWNIFFKKGKYKIRQHVGTCCCWDMQPSSILENKSSHSTGSRKPTCQSQIPYPAHCFDWDTSLLPLLCKLQEWKIYTQWLAVAGGRLLYVRCIHNKGNFYHSSFWQCIDQL
jgi:hypothetical protein